MGTSLVQWLICCISATGDAGSVPGGKPEIPHAEWCGKTKQNRTHPHAPHPKNNVAETFAFQQILSGMAHTCLGQPIMVTHCLLLTHKQSPLTLFLRAGLWDKL